MISFPVLLFYSCTLSTSIADPCEEVMKKNYLEIGKIYFEQYSDMPEPPFEKQCEAIKNSQRAIADLQEKIDQLKTK